MLLVADGDHKLVLRSMAAASALALVTDNLAILVDVDVGAVLVAAATPSAQTDHTVELLPIRPAIVGGVDDHKGAALLHPVFKVGLGLLGPGGGVVAHVADHQVVLGEVGREVRVGLRLFDHFGFTGFHQTQPCLLALRLPKVAHAGDIDAEHAGLLEVGFHHHRGLGPDRMVVLTVDDEGFHLLGGGRKIAGNECDRGDEVEGFHENKKAGDGGLVKSEISDPWHT